MTSTTATSTMRPPRSEVGLIGWLRKNLFSSVTNTLLTIIGLWIIWKVITAAIGWAILSATFEGSDGAACSREHAGACWPFIQAKFSQFMYGRYPEPQRWRVDLTYVLAIAGLVPLMIPSVPGKLFNTLYMIVFFPIAAFFLLVGGYFGLPYVPTELWGGLLVTLVVASVGIAGAFPIGILLALGRRSKMPIVRWVSVGFIELVRGVPLITVLFMASVMLPLFLPEGVTIDKLLRALIMVALFSASRTRRRWA
jgi:general L-amino acid transport system permease protein